MYIVQIKTFWLHVRYPQPATSGVASPRIGGENVWF